LNKVLRKVFVPAIWMLLLLGMSLNSCRVSYSFTGASISPDVKTISISYFPNNASLVVPTLSRSFTDALRDYFNSQTSLTMVDRGGDLNIEGAITGFTVAPEAIQANETAAQNRLTITVKVKFTNRKNEKQNWESEFVRYQSYSTTQNLNSVQDQLIKEINDMLVQDIFNKAVVNW
jgi:hypothetical protein